MFDSGVAVSLLGTSKQANGEDARKVGEFVGYKSLYVNLAEALHAGQVWFNYDTAIHSLVSHILHQASANGIRHYTNVDALRLAGG